MTPLTRVRVFSPGANSNEKNRNTSNIREELTTEIPVLETIVEEKI